MAVRRLDEIVLDCADPTRLVRFWGALFGIEPVFRELDWTYIDSPVTRVRIAFQRVPEPKSVKNRVHLDVEVDDIAAEAARLVGLGARTVGTVMEDEYGRFQVMQDPEGNEFCLIH
jgi:predicted enzyme related to lactoylglutathione lyase